MKRVLFLCTENACRSQMAEALTNYYFGDRVQAYSAGIRPKKVHPLAREVLSELGIDTSNLKSKPLKEFQGQKFDLVITLCDSAQKECPYFPGAQKILHLPFPDPAKEEKIEAFRHVRDLILSKLWELFPID